MREFLKFLSDFGDSFFRGGQGKLALAMIGTAVGMTICAMESEYTDEQRRELYRAMEAFTVIGILLLLIRPIRNRR